MVHSFSKQAVRQPVLIVLLPGLGQVLFWLARERRYLIASVNVFRLKQLESNFEDDVVVTSVRKITEFSADDCQSIKFIRRDATMIKSDSDASLPLPPDFEENAIFEHESALYGGDVLNVAANVARRSSDSGTGDDDELLTIESLTDTYSSSSSSQLTPGIGVGVGSNREVLNNVNNYLEMERCSL